MLKITPSPAMRAEVRRLAKLTGQMEFATALALTRTAQAVKKELEAEIDRVFDRPTSWTRRSLFLQPARKNNLDARVWIKDGWGWKTTPPERYLRPHIYGGSRTVKRFERALQIRGILPPGMVTVPAADARLDAYGNMSRGQIVQILSYFSAFEEKGFRANITEEGKRRRARSTRRRIGTAYFALQRPHGKLKPGIYQRYHLAHGSAVKPVMLFIKDPKYRPRFDFFGAGQRTVDKVIDKEFSKALARAIATAR